jgi:uncharacterized protein YggU (UPF0235/DUF167 family)
MSGKPAATAAASAAPSLLSLARDGRVLLAVRAHPSSRGGDSLELDGAVLHAHTSAKPVDGEANAAIEKAVAKALGAPRSACEVVRGHKERDKVVAVRGVALAAAQAALEALR